MAKTRHVWVLVIVSMTIGRQVTVVGWMTVKTGLRTVVVVTAIQGQECCSGVGSEMKRTS